MDGMNRTLSDSLDRINARYGRILSLLAQNDGLSGDCHKINENCQNSGSTGPSVVGQDTETL